MALEHGLSAPTGLADTHLPDNSKALHHVLSPCPATGPARPLSVERSVCHIPIEISMMIFLFMKPVIGAIAILCMSVCVCLCFVTFFPFLSPLRSRRSGLQQQTKKMVQKRYAHTLLPPACLTISLAPSLPSFLHTTSRKKAQRHARAPILSANEIARFSQHAPSCRATGRLALR